MPDLITLPYALGFLADLGLSPAQQAKLPDAIAGVSAAVRRFCNRQFTAATFDELYTVGPGDRRVTLRQFPVISVERVAANPTAIVEVWNTDANATRATAALATTGDTATGLVATGLALTRWSSGARVATSVPFTDDMTATALAAAVVAAGGSWQAQAASGFALWPVADLRPPQGPVPCKGSDNRAGLVVHADDVPADVDERLGYLTLGSQSGGADSPRWGPAWSGPDDGGSYGGRNGLRVVYTAGFDSVPADVQLATAEAVKAALQRFQTDATLQSESDGVISWAARAEQLHLPAEVMRALNPWVNRRAG